MEAFLQDLRQSARTLLKNPSFTAVAVGTLILAIGANSAIFSVLYTVVLRPLPYPNPDQLVIVWNDFAGEKMNQTGISAAEYIDFVDETKNVFQEVSLYLFPASVSLTQEGEPEQLEAARVTSSFFSVIGSRPALGRTFLPEEDDPGRGDAVVLSHGLWERRFGSDPHILGRKLILDGNPMTVVGVMPPGFVMPGDVALWAPLVIDPANLPPRGNHNYEMLARLKAGVSIEQGNAGMAHLARWMRQRYLNEYPEENRFTIRAVPLQEQIVGDIGRLLFLFWAAVSVLLLIACANLGNLLLVRAQKRERELAVRSALGATRFRLVRYFLTESMLLSLVGGGLGMLLSFWATRLMISLNAENIPRAQEIGVQPGVLLFTLGISLLAGTMFGLIPAIHMSRRDLSAPLKDASCRSTASSGGGGRGLRNVLLVSQVALALVLVVCAGLVVKSFMHLQRVDPGFRTDHLLTLKVSPPTTKYDPDQRAEFYRRALEELRSIPGIQEAGAVNYLPLTEGNFSASFSIEGRPLPSGEQSPEANRRTVSPDYFKAMGIPLLTGRTFSAQDRDDPALGVVIIDDKLAQRHWPGEDPLGKRLAMAAGIASGTAHEIPWLRIVGVVGHVQHEGLGVDSREHLYVPYTQAASRSMYFVLRTKVDPLSIVPTVRNRIQALDKDLPLYDIETMEHRFAAALDKPRFASALLTGFAAVALALAALGIFGLTTYSVSQRTQEIGIRLAIGAHPTNVLRMVIWQAMRAVLVGLALGLLGAFAATRLFARELYQVDALDPLTFTAMVLILGVVALVACSLPAARAARVDPTVSLRQV
jgi:putative ABC transport system permease protein